VVAVEIGIRLLYGKIAFEQAFCVLLSLNSTALRLLGRPMPVWRGWKPPGRIFKILTSW
jgi:hypothetical protein